MPKLTGVVVAIENEDLLLSALEEDQHMTAEKEYLKKEERLFKNWKKLLNGLKIQERLQREYGEKQVVKSTVEETNGGSAAQEEYQDENFEVYQEATLEEAEEQPGGGFMVE